MGEGEHVVQVRREQGHGDCVARQYWRHQRTKIAANVAGSERPRQQECKRADEARARRDLGKKQELRGDQNTQPRHEAADGDFTA